METVLSISQIYKIAITSRIGFLFLSIISNYLILDHNSDSFKSPLLFNEKFSNLDKIIWILFGGLLRWDAQHFFHIYSSGYTYENNLPFFPLFPMINKMIAFFLKLFLGLNMTSSYLFAAFLSNCIFFMKASSTLYVLTLTAFKNDIFAYCSVLFFCISPATIFFLAPYSETLFTYCVFKGMLKYMQHKYWSSLLWFSISVLIRSNGIVNVGFIIHLFYYFIVQTKFKNIGVIIRYLLYSILSICCICLPFIVFQLYTYLHFCLAKQNHTSLIKDYAIKKNLILSGHQSEWCNNSIPFSYGYIQSHYWNVGFLKYYQFKQIPNFCLALPIVILILNYCGKYLCENWKLFIYADKIYNLTEGPLYKIPSSLFVFVVHILYLTIFAFTHINVQVTTRLIASSSPIIYWIASQEFLDLCNKSNKKKLETLSFLKWLFYFKKNFKRSGNLIKLYFIFFSVTGIILFSNNFPWT